MAMQRVNQGLAIIVPVILTETPGWKQEDWCTLQALPSGVRPVDDASWRKPERAFADVEEELRKLIALLPAKLAKKAAEWNHGAGSGGDGGEPPMLPPPVPVRRGSGVLVGAVVVGAVVVGLLVAAAALWLVSEWSGSRYLRRSDAPMPGPVFTPAPASALSPELLAWVNDPKVKKGIINVYAGKGSGYGLKDMQELKAGTEVVMARRQNELPWLDQNTKKLRGLYNGVAFELVILGETELKITKPIKPRIYFNAAEVGSANVRADSILLDPRADPDFKNMPCQGSALEVAPGFSYYTGSGDQLWNEAAYQMLPVQLFTGKQGKIPAGNHPLAVELSMEGRPVYRGVFDLHVPVQVYNQPLAKWIAAVAEPKIQVTLVPDSVTRPAAQTLQWKILLEGDASGLQNPLASQCHYDADEPNYGDKSGGATAPLTHWVGDPMRANSSIEHSQEIEGMNYAEFTLLRQIEIREDIRTELPMALHCGEHGSFPAGPHDVAVEILSRGLPVWRGLLKLTVPE